MRALCSFVRVDVLAAMWMTLCDLGAEPYKAPCSIGLCPPRIYMWKTWSSVAVFRCGGEGAWWEVVRSSEALIPEMMRAGLME